MPAPLVLMLTALLLPLGAFVLLTLAGRRMGAAICGTVGTAASVAAFSAALVALMQWLSGGVWAGEEWGVGRAALRISFPWSPGPVGGGIVLGLHVDSLSILVVTAGLLVSCAVHVFTTGYLRNDVRGPRTFSLLALGDAALVGLATAASLPQWAAWGVAATVAAYLLATPVPLGPGGLGITPVPRGLTAADLGQRANASLTLFILRALGDAALLLACGLLLVAAPTLSWGALWSTGTDGVPQSAVTCLLIAAVCHAGAFPAALFLPDAKGFPTPAAALSFAVTLLPTGPLLIARVFPLLSEGDLAFLSFTGAATILIAGVAAFAESDLRRLLAWFSVAGVGAMFAAAGTGSFGGMLLHLLASMFGVAILLLAGGSALHACEGERRLSHYGGLLFRMPATALLMAHGAGTLLGGPLLAGSGSWNTMFTHAYRGMQAGELRSGVSLAALSVGLALLCVAAGRGWSLVFLGRPRDRVVWSAARESATLTVPVALLSLVASVSGQPLISPVRQLVIVTPAEMASVVLGERADREQIATWPGMALAREVAPPVVRPPPPPEDTEALEELAEAPVPPDDRSPRLIDPFRWGGGFALAALGLAVPEMLRRGGPRDRARAALARAGYASAILSRGMLFGSSLVGIVFTALESFVLAPASDLLTRVLLPFARRAPRISPDGSVPAGRGRLLAVAGFGAVLIGAFVYAGLGAEGLPFPAAFDLPDDIAGLRGCDLSLLSAVLPALGVGLLAVVFMIHGLARGLWAITPGLLRRGVSGLAPVWDLVPTLGRVSRAVSWFALFSSLLCLLVLPLSADPFGLRAVGAPLSLDEGRWLVALAVSIAVLCAAVAAWEGESHVAAWVGLLVVNAACLVAVGAIGSPALALAGLDLAAVTLAALTALWSPRDLPADRGGLLRDLRRYVGTAVLASACGWGGLVLISRGYATLGPVLVAAGLALRCGVVPLHLPVLGVHTRLAAPGAMLVVGAVIPAAMVALWSPSMPHLPAEWAWVGLALCLAGFVASARESDLRRAVGRWTTGAATLAFALLLTSPPDSATTGPRAVPAFLLALGLASAATMATFITGVIERDAGHREVSRLRGLAARSPAAFGWTVLAALFLVGAPPSATFAAAMLIPGSYPAVAGLGYVVAAACALVVLHRTFLGLPRNPEIEETPIDLTGRQKLVLLLLLTLTLAGAAAPATLLQP